MQAFQPSVLLAERLLKLRPHQQRRTLWRLDAGFGSDDTINWLLARDYQLVTKGYNSRRAHKVVQHLAAEVWQPVRANQWVAVAPNSVRYARRTQTLAVRWINKAGKEKEALLIHTLFHLDPLEVVHFYNARGGMEAEIKQDKVGLLLVQRRKRRLNAQVAWVILTDMAHNLLAWSHDWMWVGSRFEDFGHLRLVQDVLSIPGHLEFKGDKLTKVALQRSHPFAPETLSCLKRLLTELC